MDNADRAARLAQIFGWEHNEAIIWTPWNRFGFSREGIFESGSKEFMLDWLLRELPKHKLYPAIGYDMEEEDYGAMLFDGEGNYRADNVDPLIALVDAVLAAHEGDAK